MLLMAAICTVIGLIYLISPKTGWKITKSRQYMSEEPTGKALVWGRIGGAALILLAVILIVKYFSGG